MHKKKTIKNSELLAVHHLCLPHIYANMDPIVCIWIWKLHVCK